MELINSIYNVVNKVLDPNINILYEPYSETFDQTINSLQYNTTSLFNNNHIYKYYDCIILNNWQQHAVNRPNIVSKYQISDIVFFHEECPDKFKKEDKVILANNLKTSYKIFPTEAIAKSWGFVDQRSLFINYGIAQHQETTPFNEKSGTVLVSSSTNNQITSLYNFIKQHHTDTELVISSQSISHRETISRIEKASIIIDIDSVLSGLLSVSLGSYLITNKVLDNNLQSSIAVQDLRHIPNAISYIKSNNLYNLLQQDREHIKIRYDLNVFLNEMRNLLTQIKSESFTI